MAWGDMPAHWYDAYDRGRPGYPPAVVDIAGLSPQATVLELAAGTGRLTRVLRSRWAHVIATEPDPSMRRFLVEHVQCVEGADHKQPIRGTARGKAAEPADRRPRRARCLLRFDGMDRAQG